MKITLELSMKSTNPEDESSSREVPVPKQQFQELPLDDNAAVTIIKCDELSDAHPPGISFSLNHGITFYPSGFGLYVYENCTGVSIQVGLAFFYCTRLMIHCPDKGITVDSHLNLETHQIPALIHTIKYKLDEFLRNKGVELSKRKISIMPGFMPSPGEKIDEPSPGIKLFNQLKNTSKPECESIKLLENKSDSYSLDVSNGCYFPSEPQLPPYSIYNKKRSAPKTQGQSNLSLKEVERILFNSDNQNKKQRHQYNETPTCELDSFA